MLQAKRINFFFFFQCQNFLFLKVVKMQWLELQTPLKSKPFSKFFQHIFLILTLLVDDGHGMNVASVMNLIDDSLKKYDVDTRSCLSRTMCNQYAQRVLEGEEEAVQRISRGLIENIAQYVISCRPLSTYSLSFPIAGMTT